jgi:hypothetical protein
MCVLKKIAMEVARALMTMFTLAQIIMFYVRSDALKNESLSLFSTDDDEGG